MKNETFNLEEFLNSEEYQDSMQSFYDQTSETEMKFKTRDASLDHAIKLAALAGREVRPEEIIQIASVFEEYLLKP